MIMTREEQIRIASVDNADKRFKEIPDLGFAIDALADYDNGLTKGFNDGAKWADENPKDGMVSLDKVCEWLEEHMSDFCSECAEQALISWLRKAMEE